MRGDLSNPLGVGRVAALMGVALCALAGPVSSQSDSWTSPLAPMPTPRRLLAAAAEGEKIYTFGGCGSPCFSPPVHTSTEEETRLEVYDPGKNSWSVGPRIPAIFFGGAAAAPGGGKIYLFGGIVTRNHVYEYNTEAQTWARKAPMPTPRHGLAAVTLNQRIYVLGGSDGSTAKNALEVYDPVRNTWRRLQPMRRARVYLAAAAVGGKIYAIGGSPDCCGNGRTDAVEIYDPATDRWSDGPALPVALQVSAAAVANGRIYVFGGFIPGEGAQRSTFEYDPATGNWTEQTSMPTARDQAPAVAVRNLIYVLGGSVDCHCRALDETSRYTPRDSGVQPPSADLSIQIENDVDEVKAGDRITYTITASNAGPDAVTGATVTDTVPGALTNVTRTCVVGCAASDSTSLTQKVDLGVNATMIYTLTGTLDPRAAATLSKLTIPVKIDPPSGVTDADLENNRDEENDPVVPCLSITKDDGRSLIDPGDDLLYRMTITNRCAVAVPATVRDLVSATGLDDFRWCRDTGTPCTPSIHTDIDESLTLPPQGTVTYRVAGTVPCACTARTIENTVCVTSPFSPRRCDTDIDSIRPATANLELGIIAPSDVHELAIYTISVTNRGPQTARNVVLTAEHPGFELVALSSPCAAGLPCTLGAIAPDAEVRITVSLAPVPGCLAVAKLTASVESCCDRATQTHETRRCNALSITKSDSLETAEPGDPILYTILVKSPKCPLSGARVTDDFPDELQDVRWCRGKLCDPESSPPLVDTLDLLADGEETYRVAGTVDPHFIGDLKNKVDVEPPGCAVQTAEDTTSIAPAPGVTVLCAGLGGGLFEGGVIVKSFTVLNGGPEIFGDDPGPEFEDILPAGLTLVDATASRGTITTAANTVSWNGSIPVGELVMIEIEATVDAGTLGTTLCNTGTISFDGDGDGSSDSADCCFVVRTELEVIPTLSDLGLAVAALLLTALALARLRRHAR